jgi:non-ribosomal peptide synthetase component E (peptide arylation enzyme)
LSSQGPNHPEPRVSADVLGARSQALGDLLRRTAARKPDKLALVNGELRWSYRELDQAAISRPSCSVVRTVAAAYWQIDRPVRSIAAA